MLCESILVIYLIVMAIWDLVTGHISMRISFGTSVVLLVFRVVSVQRNEVSWIMAFSGVIVGIGLILLAKLSRGGIGAGDGVVFVVTGLVLEMWENVILLFMSLWIVGILGAILLVIRRVRRKTLIPFVPFILLGYGVMYVWEIMEWM